MGCGAKKLPRTYAVRGSYGFLCSFRSGWRKYPYRQGRQRAIETPRRQSRLLPLTWEPIMDFGADEGGTGGTDESVPYE